jgi:hypothetical protein
VTWLAVAYIVAGCVCWPLLAVMLRAFSTAERFDSVSLAGLLGLIWPLSIAAAAVYWLLAWLESEPPPPKPPAGGPFR